MGWTQIIFMESLLNEVPSKKKTQLN